MRGVVARCRKYAAAWVHTRASQVQTSDARYPIIRQFGQRAKRKHLIKRHFDVHHVAAQQAERALQIQRRLHITVGDRAAHIGRVTVHHFQQFVGFALADAVPIFAIFQFIRVILAP